MNTTINFQITGIKSSISAQLFNLSNNALNKLNAVKRIVDSKPNFPCRVSLEDAEIGEEVILFPYKDHDVASPYAHEGPVFVRNNAIEAALQVNEIPAMLHFRTLSLRGFNKNGSLVDACITDGSKLQNQFQDLFLNASIEYIHVYNAGYGCFNCKVNRMD